MKTFITNLSRDETGATAIEYGLIAALIAVAAITAMQSLGTEISSTFNNVETELSAARGGSSGGTTSGGTTSGGTTSGGTTSGGDTGTPAN